MVTYYAKALNANRKVAQLLVTKEAGQPIRQAWTGVVYKNDRAADADIARLNVDIAKNR